MKKNNLFEIARLATMGDMEHEAAHAMIQAASGKSSIFKTGEELPVKDINGNPIIAGKVYEAKRGGEYINVLVTHATFGAGNIMDTYYRVHYIYGEEFKNGFNVVNGRGDIFKGFEYRGDFEPVEEEQQNDCD